VEDVEGLDKWRKVVLNWRGRDVHKMVDVHNLSEVENYLLATRSLSRRKAVFNEEAR
jgi:hypothetical protein